MQTLFEDWAAKSNCPYPVYTHKNTDQFAMLVEHPNAFFSDVGRSGQVEVATFGAPTALISTPLSELSLSKLPTFLFISFSFTQVLILKFD